MDPVSKDGAFTSDDRGLPGPRSAARRGGHSVGRFALDQPTGAR